MGRTRLKRNTSSLTLDTAQQATLPKTPKKSKTGKETPRAVRYKKRTVANVTPKERKCSNLCKEVNRTYVGDQSCENLNLSQSGIGEVIWSNDIRPRDLSRKTPTKLDEQALVRKFSKDKNVQDLRPSTPPLVSLWMSTAGQGKGAKRKQPQRRVKRINQAKGKKAVKSDIDSTEILTKLSAVLQGSKDNFPKESAVKEEKDDIISSTQYLQNPYFSSSLEDVCISPILQNPSSNKPTFIRTPISSEQSSPKTAAESVTTTPKNNCKKIIVPKNLSKLSMSSTPKGICNKNTSNDDLWTDEELFENDSFLTATQAMMLICGEASPIAQSKSCKRRICTPTSGNSCVKRRQTVPKQISPLAEPLKNIDVLYSDGSSDESILFKMPGPVVMPKAIDSKVVTVGDEKPASFSTLGKSVTIAPKPLNLLLKNSDANKVCSSINDCDKKSLQSTTTMFSADQPVQYAIVTEHSAGQNVFKSMVKGGSNRRNSNSAPTNISKGATTTKSKLVTASPSNTHNYVSNGTNATANNANTSNLLPHSKVSSKQNTETVSNESDKNCDKSKFNVHNLSLSFNSSLSEALLACIAQPDEVWDTQMSAESNKPVKAEDLHKVVSNAMTQPVITDSTTSCGKSIPSTFSNVVQGRSSNPMGANKSNSGFVSDKNNAFCCTSSSNTVVAVSSSATVRKSLYNNCNSVNKTQVAGVRNIPDNSRSPYGSNNPSSISKSGFKDQNHSKNVSSPIAENAILNSRGRNLPFVNYTNAYQEQIPSKNVCSTVNSNIVQKTTVTNSIPAPSNYSSHTAIKETAVVKPQVQRGSLSLHPSSTLGKANNSNEPGKVVKSNDVSFLNETLNASCLNPLATSTQKSGSVTPVKPVLPVNEKKFKFKSSQPVISRNTKKSDIENIKLGAKEAKPYDISLPPLQGSNTTTVTLSGNTSFDKDMESDDEDLLAVLEQTELEASKLICDNALTPKVFTSPRPLLPLQKAQNNLTKHIPTNSGKIEHMTNGQTRTACMNKPKLQDSSTTKNITNSNRLSNVQFNSKQGTTPSRKTGVPLQKFKSHDSLNPYASPKAKVGTSIISLSQDSKRKSSVTVYNASEIERKKQEALQRRRNKLKLTTKKN